MGKGSDSYVGFLDTLEACLVRLLAVGLTALILVQLAMTLPSVRRRLSLTERLEGISYSEYAPQARSVGLVREPVRQAKPGVPELFTVSLELIGVRSLDGASVLVNGNPVADFDYPVATFEVKQGDLLELTCRRLSMPVSFRVRTVSPGITSPVEGDVYEAGSRVVLGHVGLSNLARK